MLCLVLMHGVAEAQIRELVLPEAIRGESSLHAASTIVGDASEGRVLGELVLVGAWTRREIPLEHGIVPSFGTRGPRWTRRFGAQLATRIAGGTGDQPLQLEQRFEVALYAASVGQTLTWQDPPRLTDRQWWRARGLVLGAFVDFPGLGFVQSTRDGDVMAAEGFPIFVGVTRTQDAPVASFQVEAAVARVTGSAGEARIINERLVVREDETTRAMAFDLEVVSARNIPLAKAPSWRFSGAFGFSYLKPAFDRGVALTAAQRPNSFYLLARLGIEHVSTSAVGTRRSELGRPLLDATDVGVEIATLHREVEHVGVDAGAQASAWWRRRLGTRVVLKGEGMVGAGMRVLERDPDRLTMVAWRESNAPVWLGRLDVGLTVDLAHRITAEARSWVEHSERPGLSGTAAPDRSSLSHGLQIGLSWRR